MAIAKTTVTGPFYVIDESNDELVGNGERTTLERAKQAATDDYRDQGDDFERTYVLVKKVGEIVVENRLTCEVKFDS